MVGHTWSPDFVISSLLWSPQFGKGLVHLVFSPYVWLIVCWLCDPLGWGDRLSTPQDQRLLLLEPWLLRRKRDCTPALFLASSACTSSSSLCSSEEEGLAPLPSSSQCRGVLRRTRDRSSSSHCRSVPRREIGQASSLTLPARTSEGEGQAFSLTMSVRSTTTCWLCRSAIARCGATCEGVRGRSRTRSATVGTLR